MIAMSYEDETGHKIVVFRWSCHLGECYECGAPAAFWIPNRAVDAESPLAPHESESAHRKAR